MTFRPFWLLLPLLLWQCATPPPPVPQPKPFPPPVVVPAGPDDDHRAVSREEFQASAWAPLPAVKGWSALPNGVSVTLADGRELRLTFVSANLMRWWVPAAAGEAPLSPGARFPSDATVKVKVSEASGELSLDTTGLGVRLKLADLSWVLVRGDKAVLHSAGGPRASGRRLAQALNAGDAVLWSGPGLTAERRSVRAWIDATEQSDGSGPFAVPALVGAGGTLPFVAALDTSYQAYTRVGDEASLGTLNGGLDLLVASSPQAWTAVEALAAVMGRTEAPPAWSHGTGLALPAGETGAFVRKAKLAVQFAEGPFRADRTSFQALVPTPSPGALPDLTRVGGRTAWLTGAGFDALPKGAGLALAAVPARQDWNTRFDDEGRDSPLARMSSRLAGLEALTAAGAWAVKNPGLRPLVVAASGGWGLARSALPEVTVGAGSPVTLAQVLAMGTVGYGTPAVRLDLTGLGNPETRGAAFQSLLSWLMAPVLTLDGGNDPAGLWASLGDADQKRLKAILDRRSQFKPLFDQLARLSSLTGRPAWSPVWFAAGSDDLARSAGDEFLLGDGLLVAPVAGASRSVYLPGPGVWFDFWSGEEFGGGKAYQVEAKADRPLLFARGGALVPLREPEVFDEKNVYNPLTVHVFPGGRGSGAYCLDDGTTQGWKQGEAWETRLTFDYAQKEMTLEHEAVSFGRFKPDPYLLYRLHNVFRPRQVKIDGKAIPLFGDSWGITDTDRSAAWYESDHTLLVKTFRPEREQTLQISF